MVFQCYWAMTRSEKRGEMGARGQLKAALLWQPLPWAFRTFPKALQQRGGHPTRCFLPVFTRQMSHKRLHYPEACLHCVRDFLDFLDFHTMRHCLCLHSFSLSRSLSHSPPRSISQSLLILFCPIFHQCLSPFIHHLFHVPPVSLWPALAPSRSPCLSVWPLLSLVSWEWPVCPQLISWERPVCP